MVPQEESGKSMGADTRRYLASFIKDLRSQAETQTPQHDAHTPPPVTKASPSLFTGTLSQDMNSKMRGTDGANQSGSGANRIVLSEKEREMLKKFSKL